MYVCLSSLCYTPSGNFLQRNRYFHLCFPPTESLLYTVLLIFFTCSPTLSQQAMFLCIIFMFKTFIHYSFSHVESSSIIVQASHILSLWCMCCRLKESDFQWGLLIQKIFIIVFISICNWYYKYNFHNYTYSSILLYASTFIHYSILLNFKYKFYIITNC